MNGTRKFHKATGPAFHSGEKWYGTSGRFAVIIISVRKYPGAASDHIGDYGVTYEWMENGDIVRHEKDAWNFQVRYQHQADLDL